MKNLTTIAISLTAVLLLQACGSDSKKAQPTVTPPVVVTPPVIVTPTEPEAVHLIQPDKVAETVEQFKLQQAEIELQIEGVKYDIEFIASLTDDNVILTRYEKGYVLIGFNFETEEPANFFRIIDSTLPFDEAQENFDRVLERVDITITEEGDNAVFTGTVVDIQTQGLLNIRLVINESLLDGGGTSVIEVIGNKATVNGDLGTKTYIQISDLINNHPEVTTLVLQQIRGSDNDAINMHTGRLVRNAQLTTMVEATSDINSGGVDLYAAGAQRIYTEGAKVGVHSWSDSDGTSADELGRDHPDHGAQLTYFREMLGAELGPEFYFFTIESAPADSIYLMTKAELDKYLLIP